MKQLLPTTVQLGEDLDTPHTLYGRWDPPWITPLTRGADLGLFVREGRLDRLAAAYFSGEGLVRKRLLTSPVWPEKWRQRWWPGPRPTLLALTPDGEHLLFQDQEQKRQEEGRDVSPLYLWRIEGAEPECLGWVPRIRNVFNWEGGRYLPFLGMGPLEGKPGALTTTYEVGVIEVTELEEQPKAAQ